MQIQKANTIVSTGISDEALGLQVGELMLRWPCEGGVY